MLARNNNKVTSIHPANIPDMDHAVAAHILQGGQLALQYGTDPIAKYSALQTLHDRDFRLMFPSTEQVFEDILHSDGVLFQQAIFFSFIEVNHRYATVTP